MNKYDLLLHVDKADGSINIAFANAGNYAAALEGESFKMLLVVNSKAVTELVVGNANIARDKMKRAVDSGLAIKVCQNAMNDNKLKAEDLFPECRVIPAGLVEIVERQREGYAYVKP